ncbi:MAG: dioxygenase [Acidimicrobiales bacterium]
MQGQGASPVTPDDITAAAAKSFDGAPDDRLRFLLQRLVEQLHAYARDVQLTPAEWAAAIAFLTEAGQTCTDSRQELILLSDTLGLSMLVDSLQHPAPPGATESTVLGPFHVPGAPLRAMGSSIVEQEGSGEPTLVSGTVRSLDGTPVRRATLDVWQNAANRLYAVQDPGQPPENLRGRFQTGADGAFAFWTVRPVDYCIPDDGPVGRMLAAAQRHPWRPAHFHLMVSAPGYRTVATHFFDRTSPHLGSDAVFGVKPSLVADFVPHAPDEPGAPGGWDGTWYTFERDVVLVAQDAVPTSERGSQEGRPVS